MSGETVTNSFHGNLTLGHILNAAGIQQSDVLVIRHTYNSDGLVSAADLTDEKILEYTRQQSHRNKIGPHPPKLWLSFIAEGGLRSRFLAAHDNHGVLETENTVDHRYFDLRASEALSSLRSRLMIEWSRDPVNWAKRGGLAQSFRVLEIADPKIEPFPGFDGVLIDYQTLGLVIEDARYRDWRTALAAVQGVYLIVDKVTGEQYVGKADGRERVLGRWREYWNSGHGGNVGLRDAIAFEPVAPERFQFSLLRVFGPDVPGEQVNAAEAHFKSALLSRQFGFNRN